MGSCPVLPAELLGVSDREDRVPFVLQHSEVMVGVGSEKDFDLN